MCDNFEELKSTPDEPDDYDDHVVYPSPNPDDYEYWGMTAEEKDALIAACISDVEARVAGYDYSSDILSLRRQLGYVATA